MIEHLVSQYLTVIASVFSILLVLQLVKKGVESKFKIPGLVWWAMAWALGVVSALIVTECGPDASWKCYGNPALIHSGIALILYPRLKTVTAKLWEKLLPGAQAKP